MKIYKLKIDNCLGFDINKNEDNGYYIYHNHKYDALVKNDVFLIASDNITEFLCEKECYYQDVCFGYNFRVENGNIKTDKPIFTVEEIENPNKVQIEKAVCNFKNENLPDGKTSKIGIFKPKFNNLIKHLETAKDIQDWLNDTTNWPILVWHFAEYWK